LKVPRALLRRHFAGDREQMSQHRWRHSSRPAGLRTRPRISSDRHWFARRLPEATVLFRDCRHGRRRWVCTSREAHPAELVLAQVKLMLNQAVARALRSRFAGCGFAGCRQSVPRSRPTIRRGGQGADASRISAGGPRKGRDRLDIALPETRGERLGGGLTPNHAGAGADDQHGGEVGRNPRGRPRSRRKRSVQADAKLPPLRSRVAI
jgi:hypothetical protein